MGRKIEVPSMWTLQGKEDDVRNPHQDAAFAFMTEFYRGRLPGPERIAPAAVIDFLYRSAFDAKMQTTQAAVELASATDPQGRELRTTFQDFLRATRSGKIQGDGWPELMVRFLISARLEQEVTRQELKKYFEDKPDMVKQAIDRAVAQRGWNRIFFRN